MKMSFLELRTKSKQVVQALDRNEEVVVTYRGKPKAVIRGLPDAAAASIEPSNLHEAFGLWADRDDFDDVDEQVRDLRKGRFDAI